MAKWFWISVGCMSTSMIQAPLATAQFHVQMAGHSVRRKSLTQWSLRLYSSNEPFSSAPLSGTLSLMHTPFFSLVGFGLWPKDSSRSFSNGLQLRCHVWRHCLWLPLWQIWPQEGIHWCSPRSSCDWIDHVRFPKLLCIRSFTVLCWSTWTGEYKNKYNIIKNLVLYMYIKIAYLVIPGCQHHWFHHGYWIIPSKTKNSCCSCTWILLGHRWRRCPILCIHIHEVAIYPARGVNANLVGSNSMVVRWLIVLNKPRNISCTIIQQVEMNKTKRWGQ